MLLQMSSVRIFYEKIEAVKGINLQTERGEVISLIGPNGAGKSSILRAICGLKRITEGEIRFEEKRVDAMATHEIVKLGISMVPEGRRLFSSLSVRKNLEMGAYHEKSTGKKLERLKNILNYFPILQERQKQDAGSLSGGEQQMLAIGRALMSGPQQLLLDEPSLGLAPLMVEQIAKIIREINIIGVSILLVEQNAAMALSVSDRSYLLELGVIILEGEATSIKSNRKVRESYLGGGDRY
jgi:branched-chain amino acid transport system ATP-binding protein